MTRPSTYLPDALASLRRREEQYPVLVATGKLDRATADREIALWNGIARDCRADGAEPLTDLPAKREALAESIRRFDRALAKAIAGLPEKARINCFEGITLWHLELLHGEAVHPILEIHEQRARMIALRDWYCAQGASSSTQEGA